jgi:hypothetical protein
VRGIDGVEACTGGQAIAEALTAARTRVVLRGGGAMVGCGEVVGGICCETASASVVGGMSVVGGTGLAGLGLGCALLSLVNHRRARANATAAAAMVGSIAGLAAEFPRRAPRLCKGGLMDRSYMLKVRPLHHPCAFLVPQALLHAQFLPLDPPRDDPRPPEPVHAVAGRKGSCSHCTHAGCLCTGPEPEGGGLSAV